MNGPRIDPNRDENGTCENGTRESGAPDRTGFRVRDLGRMGYREAYDAQIATHAAVAAGEAPPTLLLVEHPPVITFGKKGGRDNLRASEAALRAEGFELHDVERGGDVTYHGPGQLVGYPVFRVGRRVQAFLRDLEGAMVDALAEFGIAAEGSPGYAGVWVGNGKVVAIGVAIKRDVSFHGFAMNVATDLSHFDRIVPCGLEGKGVASVSSLLGRPVGLDEVKPILLRRLRERFPRGEAALPDPAGAPAAPIAGLPACAAPSRPPLPHETSATGKADA